MNVFRSRGAKTIAGGASVLLVGNFVRRAASATDDALIIGLATGVPLAVGLGMVGFGIVRIVRDRRREAARRRPVR